MPINRITHFANASDVNSVVVDGKLLLDDRKPVQVSPDAILEEAEAEANRVFTASGNEESRRESQQIWSGSRRQTNRYRPAGSALDS
jgi:hypothetical protein